MGINQKTTQMRTVQSCYKQGNQPQSPGWERNWKAVRWTWKLTLRKREVVRCSLIRGCWHGEAGNGLTRSRASSVIGLETYLAFSGCSELEVGDKMQGPAVQILTILGQMLQKPLFGFGLVWESVSYFLFSLSILHIFCLLISIVSTEKSAVFFFFWR